MVRVRVGVFSWIWVRETMLPYKLSYLGGSKFASKFASAGFCATPVGCFVPSFMKVWFCDWKFYNIIERTTWKGLRFSEEVAHRCSVKKSVFRNFAQITGKHLCQSLFFDKVPALRPATLLKKRLWHRCFPVNFVKFLRTPFLKEHLRWLLLVFITHCIAYKYRRTTSISLFTK